jgi:hypothetical protein
MPYSACGSDSPAGLSFVLEIDAGLEIIVPKSSETTG